MLFQKAQEFVYRNARPLELALWKYFFEDGSKEEVLKVLSFYQNTDGGFGHALEADVWNPDSIPMGTWKATEILANIGFTDTTHPLLQGILKYLESGNGFDKNTGQWTYSSASNNDYPHAIWWTHAKEPEEFNPNPNAALAGFLLNYADENSTLYRQGRDMAVRSYDYMIEHCPITDMHAISCYIRLYDYCIRAGETELFDMDKFRETLIAMVDGSLCTDTEEWSRNYVSMPSTFIKSGQDFLYAGKEALVEKERQFIKNSQLEDGSFPILWNWGTDYREEEIARNWWKSQLIIEKLLFVKNFGE